MAANTTPILDVRGLRVEFPQRHGTFVAVDGLDLSVHPGEIHGLVGESGAGKSTVGNAVIGLLEPPGRVAAGEVAFMGKPLSLDEDGVGEVRRGRDIGVIFQDPLTSLNPLFTVESQLVETMRWHLGLERAAAAARAVELLQRVGIPDAQQRAKHYPHSFSGGMRQRVVIAMALSCEPKLVIADEPTTALDVSVQAQILALIRELCAAQGVGVLLVTHDMGVIAEITDRVSVMHRGRLVEAGETAQVLGRPRHAYTKSLIAAVPRTGFRVHRFPRVAYGEAAEPAPPGEGWLGQGAPAAGDGPLLELRGVCKDFPASAALLFGRRRLFRAVDEVSFAVRRGEVFGLVGESGSGKSTVAQIIAGLYRPSAGAVWFDGALLSGLREAALRPHRRRLQMVFQDPYSSLNARMRVRDIVAEPVRFHKLATDKEVAGIVADLLARVGLERDAAARYPHEFSGGQRQRIAIARALATRPDFLICDEPTSSLDVSIQAQILNLIKDLRDALGLTVLLISHDLPVIRQMCDRVAVMQAGRVREIGDTETLFARPQDGYTRRLLDLMPKLDALSREGLDVEPAQREQRRQVLG